MKSINWQFFILMFLTILFNIIFWNEKLGLNLVLFSIPLWVIMFAWNPQSIKVRNVQISFAFTVMATTMVLWHNSLISKIAYFSSMFIFTAYVHQHNLASVIYAMGYSIQSFFKTSEQLILIPFGLPKKWLTKNKILKTNLIYLRLSLIPIFIFLVFFLLFRESNPIFKDLGNWIGNNFGGWLEVFFTQISFERIFFTIWGLILITFCLYNWHLKFIKELEALESGVIHRQRWSYKGTKLIINMIALKNEYRVAVMTMAMVNLLLLIVNFIDIQWLWFGLDVKSIKDFKALVHNGTYTLILSILLSMGIMLYFFRENLNFYKQNIWLKRLAFLWILQNGILSVSVALRVYYYIYEMGLAYKRIGVLIFLLLTLVGLITIFQKIAKQKSAYFLLKTNSWAAYCMLILMSVVDWDVLIAQYNLRHHQTGYIALAYNLSLSDKVLPLIDQYKHNLNLKKPIKDYSELAIDTGTYIPEEYIKRRIMRFKAQQKSYTWLSWNYSDYKVTQYFLKQKN